MNSVSSKTIVLIVEDDPDDRFLLKEALKDFGDALGLRFLEDGEELMEYLRQDSVADPTFPLPNLILLDLQMPRKSGREVLMEIKQDANLRRIPVIVWTTSDLEDDREFCMETGAVDFVTKPANFDDLKSSVQDIIRTWLQLFPSR